ncbi:hypothetical protein ACET3Z_029292 [Daucus carota]
MDELLVCVDRIIASACFESVSERGERLLSDEANHHHVVQVEKLEELNKNGEMGGCSECRICQEEDEQHHMEAPCACTGTLKFAHRKCIQLWCNKKGDITCEICNQVFSPNYDLPPAKNNSDVMAIDIRQAWGANIDLRDPHFLAFAAAESRFLQAEYEEYAVANSASVACFRPVAFILMFILLLRQALMLTRDSGMMRESSTFFNIQISLLQLAGFLLPCYAMARLWYIVQSRRRQGQIEF